MYPLNKLIFIGFRFNYVIRTLNIIVILICTLMVLESSDTINADTYVLAWPIELFII